MEGLVIDLSDLSHSFPFLHLSRKLGLPYQHVLMVASHYDRRTLRPPADWVRQGMSMGALEAIWNVCHSPWRWDMSRTGERGL
jgi:hypothetical protein